MPGKDKASQIVVIDPTDWSDGLIFAAAGATISLPTTYYPQSADTYVSYAAYNIGAIVTAPKTGTVRVFRAIIGVNGSNENTGYGRLYNLTKAQTIYEISKQCGVSTDYYLEKQSGSPLASIGIDSGDALFAQVKKSDEYIDGVLAVFFCQIE